MAVHGVMGVVSWIIHVGSSGDQKWRTTVFASRKSIMWFRFMAVWPWAWRQIVGSSFLKFS